MPDQHGFNVGNPIKVIGDGDKFAGALGRIEDRSPGGDYWCSLEGFEGCYRFSPKSLELHIIENIIEIVVKKGDGFPLDLTEALKAVRYLGCIDSAYYTISRYDLQRRLWQELKDCLESNAEVEEITDYAVQYKG